MKCEHGLTTKECYVCMSPKYGKHDTKQERVAKPQVEKHMSIEVMKQALEALERYCTPYADGTHPADEAIVSLRQAIEQAEKNEHPMRALLKRHSDNHLKFQRLDA